MWNKHSQTELSLCEPMIQPYHPEKLEAETAYTGILSQHGSYDKEYVQPVMQLDILGQKPEVWQCQPMRLCTSSDIPIKEMSNGKRREEKLIQSSHSGESNKYRI